MSTANLTKKFSFENSGEREVNDVYYQDFFELSNFSYSFKLTPKTIYWRFGIRLYKSKEDTFDTGGPRHLDTNFPVIHIGIGHPLKEWQWSNPNRFHLVQYHLPGYEHDFNRQETYIQLGEVIWDLKYNEEQSSITSYCKAAGCNPFTLEIKIPNEYKYFKIFAWADKIGFEIDSTIQVTPLGINSGEINLTSSNFWFLKLSPESWVVENFRVGSIEEFSTHKYSLTEPNTIVGKRPEYELYFKVNKGDKVIGYAYQNHNSAVCLFDIIAPVHINKNDREIIGLKVSEVLEPKIPIELFRNKIKFENELNGNSQIRLIEISKAIYDEILNLNSEEVYEDKVNLLNDNISKEDLLFRTPFVNALAEYIYRLWETQQQEAYTIHLSGEWGSGKSNILNFLENRLENKNYDKAGKKIKTKSAEDWLIIRYNAWENQHINPPWWVFMDNVYRGIQKKEPFYRKFVNWIKELWWRAVSVNLLYWISFLLFAFVTFLIIKQFHLENIWTKSENDVNKEEILKPIIALFSILGTLWLIFKGISNSLIPGSSEAALNFQKNIRDPMKIVKNHFAKVVGYTDKNVAIFIDDIDRCNFESTVRLLEGIQTLFKSSKVLYIVSGDAAWIRKCFELQYEKFQSVIDSPGHSLGDFFLEKIFQMNTAVPTLSKNVIKSFWEALIKRKEEIQQELIITDEKKLTQARRELLSKKTETEINQVIESKKGQSDEIYFRQAAVEQISKKEVIQNIKHRLEEFSIFLPPNPRSLKRLINNYALARQILILQGTSLSDVNPDSLVRWLILSSKFPKFVDKIVRNPNDIENPEYKKTNGFSDLVEDHLSPEIIKAIIGK